MKRNNLTAVLLMFLIVVGPLLGGCAVVAVLGASSIGSVATTVVEDRGTGGALDDKKVQWGIYEQWLQHDIVLLQKVTTTVREGRVLLTGIVPTQKMVNRAGRLAMEVPGVRVLYNELEVAGSQGFPDFSHDVWISTLLKSNMLFDGDVRSVNYAYEVVNGSVYLMGIAQSAAELDIIINYTRNLEYVRRVVSYVRVKDSSDNVSIPAPNIREQE